MKRPLLKLADLADRKFIEQIADGIPRIADNADSLDRTAERLFSIQEHRASRIIQGFAEEEAAKVLILLDAVRCPPEHRLDTLRCFYSHLAKRIYALTCSFPNVHSFEELCRLIDHERQPHYLDGPNDVDWIFPNSILTKRESDIYVDYVEDITEPTGENWWNIPVSYDPVGPYRRSESVDLACALCEAGARSAEGLAVIADTWRGFVPDDRAGR